VGLLVPDLASSSAESFQDEGHQEEASAFLDILAKTVVQTDCIQTLDRVRGRVCDCHLKQRPVAGLGLLPPALQLLELECVVEELLLKTFVAGEGVVLNDQAPCGYPEAEGLR